MNNYDIYKEEFNRLLKIIKFGVRHREYNKEQVFIVDVCDRGFLEYESIVSYHKSWVVYVIEKIVTKMLDREGAAYDIPEYIERRNSKEVKTKPFAFARKEKGKRVAYCYQFSLSMGLSSLRKDFKKYKGIDKIKMIFIRTDYQKEIEMCNEIERKEDGSYIEFIGFKDFFCNEFGEKEYDSFLECANEYNDCSRNIIGLKTIPIPTEKAITTFRQQKQNELLEKNYHKVLGDDISEEQKRIIKDNYISKKRYVLMTGNSDFADSYISSEWYRGIHTVTGAIDQTGLVAGYLKSVEQLLYALIRLSVNQGRRIKIKENEKETFTGKIYSDNYIDFTEESAYAADTSLGSMIRFIRNKNKTTGEFYNQDLFLIDKDTLEILIDRLYEFKDFERNDLFHKDNIYTTEEMEKIRNSAIALYCMLLGSFSFSDNDYASLIGEETNIEQISLLEQETFFEILAE